MQRHTLRFFFYRVFITKLKHFRLKNCFLAVPVGLTVLDYKGNLQYFSVNFYKNNDFLHEIRMRSYFVPFFFALHARSRTARESSVTRGQ